MLQEFKDRISIRNIRANLLLIISSFAFMGLNLQRDPQKIIALPVAMLVIVPTKQFGYANVSKQSRYGIVFVGTADTGDKVYPMSMTK